MNRYLSNETHPNIPMLRDAVSRERDSVVGHQLYSQLNCPAAVRSFMELHVYAVWDFMSLLTALQQRLTCIQVPWRPRGDPGVRRLINEIVLIEESDTLEGGRCSSHFELYLDAMRQAGARTDTVERFLLELERTTVTEALVAAGVPTAARRFVQSTWTVIEGAPVHALAATFAMGREDLIPSMFEQVEVLNRREAGKFSLFLDYLERHIEVDAEEHTPMAFRMLSILCGSDEQRWQDCAAAVRRALRERRALWDAASVAIAGTGVAPSSPASVAGVHINTPLVPPLWVKPIEIATGAESSL